MKTDIHFWSYLTHLYLEWEMFQTKVAEKIKTQILCSVSFYSKIVLFFKIILKNIVEQEMEIDIWMSLKFCPENSSFIKIW